MPQAVQGVLISCDVPTKEYILWLNDNRSSSFVIEDLDESHLFVLESALGHIRKKLEELYEENQYSSIK